MSTNTSVPEQSGTISLDIAAFFGLHDTSRIRRNVSIGLTERSYLPKAIDPRSDWVASVAVPAFRALAETGVEVSDFCTIGTGAGLDALAAIEILKAKSVVLTDLHEEVVRQAQQNVQSNTLAAHRLNVFSAAGDLLDPIEEDQFKFDLVYENLPNIPLHDDFDISGGQTSSTFITHRSEQIPEYVQRYLIALHYLALRQARNMVRAGGRVLSSIGGRIPFEVIIRMGNDCGYVSDILTFTWKRQSEPEEVIGGYAAWEHQGHGPFRFYPAVLLEKMFGTISHVAAGAQALEIERALKPYEMTAVAAEEAMRAGTAIGHTVVVMESQLR